jgi:hypothetical protein
MTYTYTNGLLLLELDALNNRLKKIERKLEFSSWAIENCKKGSGSWKYWANTIATLKERHYNLLDRRQMKYESKALQISIQRKHSCNERLVRSE